MRIVLMFMILILTMHAQTDEFTLVVKENKEQNSTAVSADNNSTLQILEQYNSAVATGALQSQPDAPTVVEEDSNVSSVIGPNTKLDDVSNIDIAKAQRKQRKVKREKEKSEGVDEEKEKSRVDTIVVKGSVLQGQISVLTSEYLSFRLIYGEGSIRIEYADVESLQTEHEYHIYFDGKETIGKITGIKDHAFLEIKHGSVKELVTISKIDRFIISEKEDDSFENKMRNRFAYWSGNFDIGIEYETQKAYNKHKLKIAGHTERKKTINKTIFDITYSYEATKSGDESEQLNKHELYSFLEQDISLSQRDLIFIEIGYDFDVPRYVDNRIYPAVGYGYRLQSSKKRWVQFKLGTGFVYEGFLPDPDSNTSYSENRYTAGLFGVDAEYEVNNLPILSRILFSGHFFYMPGIQDLRDNWLLRYSVTADIPLSKTLSLKAVGRTVTDDNPSDSIGNNKTTFDLYLSLRY